MFHHRGRLFVQFVGLYQVPCVVDVVANVDSVVMFVVITYLWTYCKITSLVRSVNICIQRDRYPRNSIVSIRPYGRGIQHVCWWCKVPHPSYSWLWFTLMTHQSDFCCTTLLRNLLRTEVARSATIPNAAATKRATNMASSDTDHDDLISATLLVGAVANVHKRNRPELIKEVSGHMSGLNSVRDEVLSTAYFANSIFNSVHSISINKAIKQRIN